jgi:hypothetical protein
VGNLKAPNDDDDFPPSEDFKGMMMMLLMMKTFLQVEEFNGIDSVQDDDDFPSSEDLHGRSNDIGEDGNHFPTEFDIPLSDEISNEDDDGPRNEDHVLSHSSVTIQGGQHSLVGSPNNVEYDYSEDDIPPSDEDILLLRMMIFP